MNDIWDGGTNTTNGFPVTSNNTGEVEGPNNKIPYVECNKKWASLFSSKLKWKAISSVPHKIDRDSGAFSISTLNIIVDENMAHMHLVLVGKFIGPHPNIEFVRSWVARKWKGKG